MIVHVMAHGPNERHLVHHLRQPRQMLADGDAVRLGRSRLVQAADAFGRFGLHVEHVDMARPAELVEENHRLRHRLREIPRSAFRIPRFLGLEQFRKAQSQQTQPAYLQRVASGKARLVESRASEGVFRRSHSGFQPGKLPNRADAIKAKVIQKQRSYKSAFGSEP